MTEAARRRTRARIRLIKIQWLLILALIVALIISFVTRPSASVPDEPESSPVRVEAPEPITETAAPEPELIELGEFKTISANAPTKKITLENFSFCFSGAFNAASFVKQIKAFVPEGQLLRVSVAVEVVEPEPSATEPATEESP